MIEAAVNCRLAAWSGAAVHPQLSDDLNATDTLFQLETTFLDFEQLNL